MIGLRRGGDGCVGEGIGDGSGVGSREGTGDEEIEMGCAYIIVREEDIQEWIGLLVPYCHLLAWLELEQTFCK